MSSNSLYLVFTRIGASPFARCRGINQHTNTVSLSADQHTSTVSSSDVQV